MSSIIEGYNYDIFISYRQKDNKYDGWVTEFVDNLKKELEATFKEEISVYFDINPHDGLLETHDVDASLKDKLKCLVFIPIISRTYCDPKSFAWEHEFKAFVDQASKDQLGMKVKLPNGNVASRVLPVCIHDLDQEDINLCESILCGVLRGIEFIYKEAGIDKPLAVGDNEKKNLNNTVYRIQIIKVAHAIREIFLGMKTGPVLEVKEKDQSKESFKEDESRITIGKPSKTAQSKLLSTLVILAVIIIAGILIYPKIFKRDSLEKLRSSGEGIIVAVMPFRNMTNDTTKNDWQNWIQDILITSLSNSEELKVKQSESINTYIQSKGFTNYASITPSVASTISRKLDANVVIYGSVIKEGAKIRVNAQLISSKTKNIYKSFQKDGTDVNIISLIDTLSAQIRDFLIISIMEKEIIKDFRQLILTNSSEAYRYYMYGNQAFYKYDYPTATEWYRKAIDIDSSFSEAIRMLAYSLSHQNLGEESKKWVLKNHENIERMSEPERLWANIMYAQLRETPNEVIKYFKLLIAYDDELPVPHSNLGGVYSGINMYDKAIAEFEKELEIYNKWGIKPRWSTSYKILGNAYHKTGQYQKEKKLYKKAEKDFPGDKIIIERQAILSLTLKKENAANEYIEKYESILKDDGVSQAIITTSLAGIYAEAGILDKSEQYFRQALSLEPENPARMNNLAYFLIDRDRNIDDGLELIEKALKISPDNYIYLHTKGWGLYKKNEFQEALNILQKSWDLIRQNGGYYHDLFIHLEAAKKAVASQKNN
jgi:tetratricopeptide (TPR) repeat protein